MRLSFWRIKTTADATISVDQLTAVNFKNTWNDNLAAIFEAKLKAAIDNRGVKNDNFQTLFLTQKYGLFILVLS